MGRSGMPLFSRNPKADRDHSDRDHSNGDDPDRDHSDRGRAEPGGTERGQTEDRLAPDDPRKPDSPTDLPKQSWLGVVKRAAKEFRDDDVTDWAAALTYYGVLALFPAMLVLMALLGLFG